MSGPQQDHTEHDHGGYPDDDHDHRHGPDHGHDHGHAGAPGHVHRTGLAARVWYLLRPHPHEAADKVDAVMESSAGALDMGEIRLRWIGHQLRAECEVIVDADASAIQAHRVAVGAEHNLLHALPRLAAALVHADPQARGGADHHEMLAPHR